MYIRITCFFYSLLMTMHVLLPWIVVVYCMLVLEGVISLLATHTALGIVFYCTNVAYFVLLIAFEADTTEKYVVQHKVRQFIDVLHTTVIVCFLFGAFSEFTSFASVYSYSSISHVFLVLPNIFLFYYNIGHMRAPELASSTLSNVLDHVALQDVFKLRHIRTDISMMRFAAYFFSAFVVLLCVIFFNNNK